MSVKTLTQTVRSVLRADHRKSDEEKISVDYLVDQIYRGLFNREPDQGGREAQRRFLVDGLRSGSPCIAEMLRSCIESPEFRLAHVTEPRAKIGATVSEAREVFLHFDKYTGPGHSGYVTNFLGGMTDIRFSSGTEMLDGSVEDYPVCGNFHAGVLEWVGTLRAVLEARDTFHMLELGAGYGPWCVIGHIGAVQRGVPGIKVVAVEGDVGHVSFISENFAINGLHLPNYDIVPGVVSITDGVKQFPKAKDPSKVYGGAPPLAAGGEGRDPFEFFMQGNSDMVEEVVEVPAHSLETLMRQFHSVDLIHCDIQGGELELFQDGIQLLTEKVKRVVVGTHSPQIDWGLMGLFASRGWMLEGAADCFIQQGTFNDGTQVWRNPSMT
jgi:FkbM family methyltransferase